MDADNPFWSNKSSQTSDKDEELPDPSLCVLRFRKSYPYTIPSFSVITVQLRHAVIQGIDDDGELKVADVFLRDDRALLSVSTPRPITPTKACYVEVEEFKCEISMDIRTINHAVFVLWEWEWTETVSPDALRFIESEDSSNDEENDDGVEESKPECEKSDNEEESVAESEIPFVTHTVTFKCIGAVRNQQSQDTLREARDRISKGFTVPVRVTPEPHNIKDSKAIAFECEIDRKWIRIGYIVKEVLDEVHAAIRDKKILSTRFSWIKYMTDWTRSGPGYFAGINISKNGDWDRIVTQYSSTR